MEVKNDLQPEMTHHNFKLEFWRFADAVSALDQLAACHEVYVEKVSIKEIFKKDTITQLKMKRFQCTVDLRTRLDLENTGLMKSVRSFAMKD